MQNSNLGVLLKLPYGKIELKSSKKFIMGVTQVRNLITVSHRETTAGQNPREFQGLKPINKKILESILSSTELFTAKHQGVAITSIGGELDKNGEIEFIYQEGCLVNGLQTVSIIRILVLLKAYQIAHNKPKILKKFNTDKSDQRWREFIDSTFSPDAADELKLIGLKHINAVLNWLHLKSNEDKLAKFNNMTLTELLNIELTVKIILLDEIIKEDVDNENYEVRLKELGRETAEANNDTQKVKPDDLFGNTYGEHVKRLFFNAEQRLPILIECRYLAEDRNSGKEIISSTDMLKCLVASTIFVELGKDNYEPTPQNFVANFAARREPLFRLFRKIFNAWDDNKHPLHFDVKRAMTIISNWSIDLVEVRMKFYSEWKKFRSQLTYEQVNKWITLTGTPLASQLYEDSGGKNKVLGLKQQEELDRVVKDSLGFPPSSAFSIFVYASRSLMKIDGDLAVKYKISDNLIGVMVEQIYKALVQARLTRTMGSTSDIYRDPAIYSNLADIFNSMAKVAMLETKDYIEGYRVVLSPSE